MNKRTKVALGGLFALGASLAIPGLAAAAPGHGSVAPVTAVTHTMNHNDTTSVSGSCTLSSPGGPVWAYDNLALKFSVTPTGTDTYAVTIYANGNFHAIANPITGDCYTGSGSVTGWYDLTVSSSTPPDAKNLPAQEDPATTQGQMVATLFGVSSSDVTGGHYHYSYTPIPDAGGGPSGRTYTQDG